MTLSVFDFGRQLIDSCDLDPVYIVLWNARLDRDKLCDFLLAYFCFYHCGTASWVVGHGSSAKEGYWKALLAAASTKEHPRASERRHFRGEAAIKAVLGLRSRRLTCSELIDGLTGPETENGPPSLDTVVSRVKEWEGFGPWIAFKVADMLERLDLAPVRFKPSDVLTMYASPKKGADLVAKELGVKGGLSVYNQLVSRLGDLKAPPRYERTIGIQEIETVLCKFFSYRQGRYEIGKDIKELHHALSRYKYCATASQLLLAGTKASIWFTK